jgi:hypothetical protein
VGQLVHLPQLKLDTSLPKEGRSNDGRQFTVTFTYACSNATSEQRSLRQTHLVPISRLAYPVGEESLAITNHLKAEAMVSECEVVSQGSEDVANVLATRSAVEARRI